MRSRKLDPRSEEFKCFEKIVLRIAREIMESRIPQ